MTKKTVITSEKREVWVIHHPSGKTTEHEAGSNEAEAAASLIRLLDKDNQDSPEEIDANEISEGIRTDTAD